MASDVESLASSFRDPSGFLFVRDNVLYRQINLVYKEHYDDFIQGGLYQALIGSRLLIPHEEVTVAPPRPESAYKIIKPEAIPFVSYPYEWCFSQLQDAALATLQIQKIALQHDMCLKDASAYNIQFLEGRPTLIDTLSFERLKLRPWVAYRQFCQHFLNPLLLIAYKDFRLNQLSRVFIDGLPLDLTSRLLPRKTRLRPGLATHVHLHALSQKYFSSKTVNLKEKSISRRSLIGLAESLEAVVKKQKLRLKKTEWANYYQETNYSPSAFEDKKRICEEFLDLIKPKEVWDMGANTGVFSRLASRRGIRTLSLDIDFVAVELNYRDCRAQEEKGLLPLLLDLTNPSPSLGWENRERPSFLERGPTDTIMALALIHHLAISNNLPFSKIGAFFQKLCRTLVIEFIPKSDSQVQRLLATREDIFPFYHQEAFEREFRAYFTIEKTVKIRDSERGLYLMRSRAAA